MPYHARNINTAIHTTTPFMVSIVSSTYILMGRYNHSLSLDATIMVSKTCLTVGEYVVITFVTQ